MWHGRIGWTDFLIPQRMLRLQEAGVYAHCVQSAPVVVGKYARLARRNYPMDMSLISFMPSWSDLDSGLHQP